MRQILKLPFWFLAIFARLIPTSLLKHIINFTLQHIAQLRPATDSLKLLLQINQYLDFIISENTIRYEKTGTHSKHRLTRYHSFFTSRIDQDDLVLDIGCGKGELSHDIALKCKANVTAMDQNKVYLEFAQIHYNLNNLHFIRGNVLSDIQNQHFDVVTFSNVMEHIENRVDFIKKTQSKVKAKKWLIRVPSYERDWKIPLMQEIGIDYRSDPTHYIEHKEDEIKKELELAGFKIDEFISKWGEFWISASPNI